ncbi:lanthionine synthetase C family protein [Thalassotalea sp. 1_MG-2023]|uniref:lanthionine synthetase C family protein n=1 Tax=Thalassotalea sp. 1_MG-2023 TaxID=3062680 RepID=UPI0026E21FA8|nr:lanthionine synthetase C family protein [Thalassotalea sp. 1_MG-2023]MDO6428887.1 lanthionine synthetase C family protein [Thalassotalea sp. 1_MG-2023]
MLEQKHCSDNIQVNNEIENLLFSITTQVQYQLANNSISLTNGLSSDILFLFNVNKFYPSRLPNDLIERLLIALFDKVEDARLDASLADGISGLGWLLDHVGVNDVTDYNDDIDDCLLEILSSENEQHEFDLLYGLVGIGIYGVNRISKPSGSLICQKVFSRLIKYSESHQDKIFWLSSQDSIFFRNDLPSPQADLGLAHGNLGVLGLFIKFYEAGVYTSECKVAINKLVCYLKEQRLADGNISTFSSHSTSEKTSLLGWCYGDLSSSLLLIKAGKLLNQKNIREFGIAIAIKTLKRDVTSESINDGSLCHGAAGIALIYTRLYQETNIQEFQKASLSWANYLIDKSNGGQCLDNLMRKHKTTAEPYSGEGVLIGYPGIGLALLSIIQPEASGWDQFLLLSKN